jgi:hypothetical protein
MIRQKIRGSGAGWSHPAGDCSGYGRRGVERRDVGIEPASRGPGARATAVHVVAREPLASVSVRTRGPKEEGLMSDEGVSVELTTAHERLLELYSSVLGRLEEVRRFQSKQGFVLRFLVKPFGERHVDKRLKQLSKLYLLRQHMTKSSSEKTWLATKREEMKQIQSELPGWTGLRAVARVLWPPVTFIGGAVLGAEKELWRP